MQESAQQSAVFEHFTAYFQLMSRAITDSNVQKLSELWALPALIVSTDQRRAYDNRKVFNTALYKLMDYHASKSMDVINKQLIHVANIAPSIYYATNLCIAKNIRGEVVSQWHQSYMLQKFEDGWKSIMTVVHPPLANQDKYDFAQFSLDTIQADTVMLD